uniref:Uncharacterized protein n=1 Tax=Triticum urartu TaxID=4572 RepID=A0A8R7U3T3_TRIUA
MAFTAGQNQAMEDPWYIMVLSATDLQALWLSFPWLCRSRLCRTELSQLSVSQRSSGFMQGLADGNDFRGCRDLHTSSSFGSEAGFGHTAAQAEAYLSRCYCS